MSRILILANNDVGLYQFRKELIGELLKDNEVIISLPKGKLVKPLMEAGCKFLNTPVDRRGINPVTDIKLFSKYFNMLGKVKPDLVITYTIKPNIYGGLATRLKKVPYAVNITGLGTAFEGNGLLRKLVTIMYNVALKKAKVVFFENSSNRELFVNEGIVPKRRTCLLNGAGVNLEHYSFADYPADNEEFRFLFVGRVMKEKGIDELFQAMNKLTSEGYNCKLDVLGGYEEDYKDKMDEYEKAGWLTYHGYQEDVRPFIHKAHAFVLPSWHEGMANTNLESASSGRPVITTNVPGCKEAVEDGVTGFLTKVKDEKSLADAMRKMMNLTVEERSKMGKLGRERMIEHFDKKKVVEKTIKHLK